MFVAAFLVVAYNIHTVRFWSYVDGFHQKHEDPFGMLEDNSQQPRQHQQPQADGVSYLAANKLQLKNYGGIQANYVCSFIDVVLLLLLLFASTY